MSIGMLLISVELLIMLFILLFIPGDYAGPCFIGFAIGESLGAAALRIAGGIFTKIADIGSDLMKIVFNIKEDDARNPGVIADCTGDNAGDSVGPSADGFETYGVTGVALITFIMLAVPQAATQVQLLVWIFVMRVMMIIASGVSYLSTRRSRRRATATRAKMNFEAPLTSLVWLTSIVSVVLTYVVSYLLIADLGDGTLWWKLSTIITCGTLAGAIIPELVKVFTSVESSHVKEVVTSSREGGASLNILSGFVAGNFSAYWIGLSIVALMSIAYFVSAVGHVDVGTDAGAGRVRVRPRRVRLPRHGPGDDRRRLLRPGDRQRAVGVRAVGDRGHSRASSRSSRRTSASTCSSSKAKDLLEENDGAGNTFKATAKPVLIGTAVVGATTMIFSIIVELTDGLTRERRQARRCCTRRSCSGWSPAARSSTGSPARRRRRSRPAPTARSSSSRRTSSSTGVEKASVEDSKKVVEICTQYAQKGMFNIFLTVFFSTLAFAFVEPFFFIGYLISIALFGLYQAVFMANAGGAWDNAKKIVETELKMKNTPLHAATVVGDTVGDPFKDTSSVALNPVIKFTTLFGLLAVALAVQLCEQTGRDVSHGAGGAVLPRSRWCSSTARSTGCGSARATDDGR